MRGTLDLIVIVGGGILLVAAVWDWMIRFVRRNEK